MVIGSIKQAAKTLVESAYEYETALEENDTNKAVRIKRYMLKLCKNIKKMTAIEQKNV